MKKRTEQVIEPSTTYLSFWLNNELFAIDVQKAITILNIKPITKVPNAPAYMRGVVNLRGNVLPIADLGLKLGLGATTVGDRTNIVVLNIPIDGEIVQFVILADAADEVFELADSKIEKAPVIGTKYNAEFIKGIYQLPDTFVMLLDIDAIFNTTSHIPNEAAAK